MRVTVVTVYREGTGVHDAMVLRESLTEGLKERMGRALAPSLGKGDEVFFKELDVQSAGTGETLHLVPLY